MPTYEYQCVTCGATLEVMQSMKDDALTRCPSSLCTQEQKGSGTVERKISNGAGVIFNGSGFYQTDYKPAPSTSAE